MTNKVFYLSILILSFISCKIDKKLKSEYLEKPEMDKINSLANRYLELNRFSGVILVAMDENVIYNNSFGLADYENKRHFTDKTTFKIGEISELITTNIIKKMAENDKLKLSDNISKYITEINADFTINNLLNHKTALPNIKTIKEQNTQLEYSTIEFTNLALLTTASTDRSDLEYNILGLLIERISGRSFQKNIQEYCTKRGIENTYFQKQDTSLAVGYLYSNYRGKGDELHKSPSYDLDIAYSSNGLKSTASDLAKIIKPKDEVNISGYVENDGFSYSIQNYKNTQTTIIVLSNRRHPVAREISNSINQIIQVEDYRLPLQRKSFEIDKKLLNEYSGTYALNQNMNFDVSNENDSLFVTLGSNKIHLIPQSSNQFYLATTDASMRFLRDSTGLVNEVVLLNGFLDGDKAYKIEE